MNRMKIALGLTILLGIMDLAIVPFMVHAHNVSPKGEPPPPVIVIQVLLGIITLVACIGLPAGKRWARRSVITTRVVDALSSVLGLAVHPSTVLVGAGAIALVLSVAVIVLLTVRAPREVLA